LNGKGPSACNLAGTKKQKKAFFTTELLCGGKSQKNWRKVDPRVRGNEGKEGGQKTLLKTDRSKPGIPRSKRSHSKRPEPRNRKKKTLGILRLKKSQGGVGEKKIHGGLAHLKGRRVARKGKNNIWL